MNHQKTDWAQQNRHRIVRWVVLALVTVLMAAVGFFHQHPLGSWTPPGVDALCPFGGLESLWAFLATGDLLTKVAASSFILLVAAVGVTLVFRRTFCGQLCPLGALQGAAAGLGKRLFGRKHRLPPAVDRPLRWLKYLVLAGVTGLTWIAGTLVVRPYDPWVAFMHWSSAELWTGFGVGAAVLIGSVAASLFYDRFFCKYLCPMGALYGLVSKLGFYRVRRDEALCIGCQKCDQVCPVDLPVSRGKDVTSAECLACGLCVTACPAAGALGISGPKAGNQAARPSPLVLTLATLGVFVAVIALTSLPGWFGLNTALGQTAETAVSAAFDPDEIKGRHTFVELSQTTGIPLQAFEDRFHLAPDALAQPLKDAAGEGTFTVADVRNFVAEVLGIEGYEGTEAEAR